MTRFLDVALEVNAAILERCCRLSGSRFQRATEFLFRTNDAHTATSTTCRCFYHYRETNIACKLQGLVFRSDWLSASGENRQSGFFHRAPRFDLVAHQTNDARWRADKLYVTRLANFGEVGRLSEETITRMNGVDIKNFCRTDDGGDVEIALCGRCRTDAGCFIGKTNVKRIPIDITVDSDRSDTHFLARPNNPAGNLAAISDQDLLKLSRAGVHATFQIMV